MAKISSNSLLPSLIIHHDEMNRFHYLVKMLPAAVAIFDTDMRYIAVSDRWYTETKIDPQEDLIGKIHYDVVPDIPLKWKLLHQRCLNGEHLKCDEDIFYRKDGQIEWLKWEITPWYTSGTIGGIFMFVEHLTDRKKVEDKMREMIKELKNYNTALKSFAHICAHDMKEPLRTIYSFIKEIEEKIGQKEEIAEHMHHIKSSAVYLNTLIKDILAYAEMDISPLNIKEVNLENVIRDVTTFLHKEIEEKKLSVSYDPLPTLYADEGLLCQLFQNLIGNSIKYNKSENPRVHITGLELKKSWIVSLEDNGIGIEPKYFKSIFEPFVRLHGKSEYPGSGLGLSRCKKIIESHRGRIWVRSDLHKGSKFSFLIPKKIMKMKISHL